MVYSANRVQEIMDDDQRESGRIPRTVECELTADLGTMTTSLDLNVIMYMYNCEIFLIRISIGNRMVLSSVWNNLHL